jgi:hypothetical protein
MRLDEERLTAELTGPIDRTIPGVQTRGEGLGPHGGNDVPGGSVRKRIDVCLNSGQELIAFVATILIVVV